MKTFYAKTLEELRTSHSHAAGYVKDMVNRHLKRYEKIVDDEETTKEVNDRLMEERNKIKGYVKTLEELEIV